MARHEKAFEAADEAQLPRNELRSLAGSPGTDRAETREDALARFLSAEDGWAEAARRLGGAFATPPSAGEEKDIAGR